MRMGIIEGMQFWDYGPGVYLIPFFFFFCFLEGQDMTCNLPSILTFLDIL
jgi:hypothetical protein